MKPNYEFVDRIVIAAENEIKDKKVVRVELVETLLRVIRDFNNDEIVKNIDDEVEVQELLNYD